jgi:long-chain fatty acid transport protein
MKANKNVLSVAVGLALAGMAGTVSASGFALIEQSASGLGNAYAGGAASAEDASTIFFNPAGMANIKGRQFVVAGHLISPSAKFSNNGSTSALGTDNGGEAGSIALIPNFYYVMDVDSQTKFGLGVNSPFGLKTEYSSGWIGRNLAIKSDLKTFNINPSISYKVNELMSLGVGIDAQYAKAELTKSGGASLGTVTVTGNDWAYGANVGALFQASDSMRVGLSYRSSVKHTLKGDVTFSALPASNGTGQADLELPSSISLSLVQAINPKWEVMGDITWTQWSSFKNLDVLRTGGSKFTGEPTPLSHTPENWSDTYRYSIGATHTYNEFWKVRIGIALDKSPVSDQYRTPRIPDNDRTWLALGGQHKVSAAGILDFGYAHLFVKDSTMNQAVQTGVNVVGNYKNSVDILSAQYTHNF